MKLLQSIYLVICAPNLISATSSNTSNAIPEIGATTVLIDDGGCAALCDSTSDCANDPHHHGSYCKYWQSPAVCFGLYNQNSTVNSNSTSNSTTGLCFQPNNGDCNDSILPPVVCPEQTNTTCALLCSITPSCIGDPTNHGSFCKLDSDVCFGLYWTSSSKTEACFQPNDPNCPSTYPVSCTGESIGTTSLPTGSTISVPSTETESIATTELTTEFVSTGQEVVTTSEIPV